MPDGRRPVTATRGNPTPFPVPGQVSAELPRSGGSRAGTPAPAGQFRAGPACTGPRLRGQARIRQARVGARREPLCPTKGTLRHGTSVR